MLGHWVTVFVYVFKNRKETQKNRGESPAKLGVTPQNIRNYETIFLLSSESFRHFSTLCEGVGEGGADALPRPFHRLLEEVHRRKTQEGRQEGANGLGRRRPLLFRVYPLRPFRQGRRVFSSKIFLLS